MSDRFRSLSDLPTSPNFSHPPSYYIQRLLRQRRSTEDKSQLVLLHRTHSEVLDPVYTGELQNQKDMTVLRFGELEEELRKTES